MDAVWKFCKSHRPYACGDQELGPEKLNSMVWSLLWVGCCNVSTSLLLNFEIETCLWTRGPSSCWMRAHHIFYIAIDARCDFDDCDQNTAQRTMLYSCRSSGEKNERQRWVWHHQGVRSPAIQIIIICYTLQTKHSVVEADRWRTKVAPPQLEVHGAKTGGGGIKLRLKISSLQKLRGQQEECSRSWNGTQRHLPMYYISASSSGQHSFTWICCPNQSPQLIDAIFCCQAVSIMSVLHPNWEVLGVSQNVERMPCVECFRGNFVCVTLGIWYFKWKYPMVYIAAIVIK